MTPRPSASITIDDHRRPSIGFDHRTPRTADRAEEIL